jgi:signal transduction histidine kinase
VVRAQPLDGRLPLLALAVSCAGFLVPGSAVVARSPAGHYAIEGAFFVLCVGAAVAALRSPARVETESNAASGGFIAAGFSALAASSLVFGIVLPASGVEYGTRALPFDVWQSAWLVAGLAFAAATLGPGLPWLRRIRASASTPGALVVLALLDVGWAAVDRRIPGALTPSELTPFSRTATDQWLLGVALALLFVVAAWRVVAARPRTLLGGALMLAGAAQILFAARPTSYRPLVQPGDGYELLVPAFALAWALLARRSAPAEEGLATTRSQLATVIAHELRNPLMAIKGLASTGSRLYETMSDAERREFFQNIDDESSRLKAIVDHTSTALRIDAGRVTYLPRTESLTELVEDAVWRAPLREHPVMLEVDPGLKVNCDRERVADVIRELLDNAAKYSPTEEPIEVRAFRTPERLAMVEVEDRGPGLPPEAGDRIFERFVRHRPKGYEQVEGAGLGLFISRAHVTAQGGRIWLEPARSEETGGGGGTIARFTLPLEE